MSRWLRHFFGCGEDTAKQYRGWIYLTTVLGQEDCQGGGWQDRLEEELWGETDNTKCLLKSHTEFCCGIYMKGSLKKSPYNEETMSQLNILYHKEKTPMPEMGNILLSHRPKGSQRPPKHHRPLSRLWVTVHNLLLKTPLIYKIKHGEIELVSS